MSSSICEWSQRIRYYINYAHHTSHSHTSSHTYHITHTHINTLTSTHTHQHTPRTYNIHTLHAHIHTHTQILMFYVVSIRGSHRRSQWNIFSSILLERLPSLCIMLWAGLCMCVCVLCMYVCMYVYMSNTCALNMHVCMYSSVVLVLISQRKFVVPFSVSDSESDIESDSEYCADNSLRIWKLN